MPAVGQGQRKLRSRPATAGDLAIRSRYFRSKVSLLSGSHEWHITLASKMSCSIANFAKGSLKILAPGNYRLVVKVTDNLSRRSVRQVAKFQLH